LRRLFRTTRGRLTLISVAILGGSFTLADSATYFAFTYAQNNELDTQLRAEAVAVGAQLSVTDGKVAYAGGDLPHETQGGSAVDIAVLDQNGVVTSTPGQPLAPAALASLANAVWQSGRASSLIDVVDSNGEARRAYAIPVASPGLVLVASTPTSQFSDSVARAMVLVFGLSVGALVAVGFLIYALVGRVLRPVSRIASLAESLSERDLHRRVDVGAPDDELGQLVATFNRMLARLAASFDTLRRFTADASHELRAPLALMTTEVERVLGKDRTTSEYRRTLNLVQAELRGMAGLVERLLLLARADAGQLTASIEEVDVADLLHETAARWEALVASNELHLDVYALEFGTAIADVGLTQRILDNLIDNAAKHSPRGGHVLLRAFSEPLRWVIEVADEGPGIPLAQRAHIFERFGQLDVARTRDGRSGVGLGLALSQAFARVQGGTLDFADREDGGTAFQLRLPMLRRAESAEGAVPQRTLTTGGDLHRK
jgi:signal transduction histidine kinase